MAGGVHPNAGLPRFPPWVPTPPEPPLNGLVGAANGTSLGAEARQATVAAEFAVLPILWGRLRQGARVANVLAHNGGWLLQIIWCRGVIDAIESLTVGDAALPGSAVATHYLGTATQTADPTLVAAFAAQGVAYADTLPGIAYSVLWLPPEIEGFPLVNAVGRWRRIYDPRLDSTNGGSGAQRLADATTWAWSRNPSLMLADFLAHFDGKALDWASVAAAANANDALIGSPESEASRLADFSADREAANAEWVKTLQLAANVWVQDQGGTVKLTPKGPGASVASYDWAAGEIVRLERMRLADPSDSPTVVRVVYTDTATTPWRDGLDAVVYAPGVQSGTTPWRETVVRMPWVTRRSQAVREATEILNHATLTDFSWSMLVYDEGVAHEVGDRITVTSPPHGLSAKLAQIVSLRRVPQGWWLDCQEYDPAVWSNQVATGPTYPNTNLPAANQPPAVTGLAVLETQEQVSTANGAVISRLRASWNTPANWPYPIQYRVEVWAAALLWDCQVVATPAYASPQVTDGEIYTVKVQTVNGPFSGPQAVASLTIQGKALPPSNVPGIWGFASQGTLYTFLTPAIDRDLWGYEYRYGVVGGAWESASLIDRRPGVAQVFEGLPAGTWVVYVKALDGYRTAASPVGQYSASATSFTVVIDLDAAAFLLSNYVYAAATLVNMTSYTLPADQTPYFVPDFGNLLGYGADNPDDAVGSFDDSLAGTTFVLPHTAGTASFTTNWLDLGTQITGNFAAIVGLNDAGAASVYLELSPDTVSITSFAGLSARASGRFVRVRVEGSGSFRLYGYPRLRVDATAVVESSNPSAPLTSNASGPTTVVLSGRYFRGKGPPVLTPLSATAAFATVTNLRLNTIANACLQFDAVVSGGGNAYCYWRISAATRVFLADDYLEYEVLLVPPTANVSGVGGFEIDCSDGPPLRNFAVNSTTDGTLSASPTVPAAGVGAWYARRIPLATLAGKTASSWNFVHESNTANAYTTLYRNVRVTDGAGTTRQTIWSAGAPSANVVAYQALMTTAGVNQANSFDVYLWSAGGAQIAAPFSWRFEGV